MTVTLDRPVTATAATPGNNCGLPWCPGDPDGPECSNCNQPGHHVNHWGKGERVKLRHDYEGDERRQMFSLSTGLERNDREGDNLVDTPDACAASKPGPVLIGIEADPMVGGETVGYLTPFDAELFAQRLLTLAAEAAGLDPRTAEVVAMSTMQQFWWLRSGLPKTTEATR